MAGELCPVCGIRLDPWLAANGYDRHIRCLDQVSVLEKRRRSRG